MPTLYSVMTGSSVPVHRQSSATPVANILFDANEPCEVFAVDRAAVKLNGLFLRFDEFVSIAAFGRRLRERFWRMPPRNFRCPRW